MPSSQTASGAETNPSKLGSTQGADESLGSFRSDSDCVHNPDKRRKLSDPQLKPPKKRSASKSAKKPPGKPEAQFRHPLTVLSKNSDARSEHESRSDSDMSCAGQVTPMSYRSASSESDIPSGQPIPSHNSSHPLSPQVVLIRQSEEQNTSSHCPPSVAPTVSDSGEVVLAPHTGDPSMDQVLATLTSSLMAVIDARIPPTSKGSKVDTVSTTPALVAGLCLLCQLLNPLTLEVTLRQ